MFKKILLGLVVGLFMFGNVLSAESIFTTLKPGSANVEGMYSVRYKEFTGNFNIQSERTFLNGWVKGKLGIISCIGVDEETEWFVGVSVDPLKKWKEQEDCPAIVKKGIFNCGVSLGITPYLNENAKFWDIIEKSRFDPIFTILSAKWEF